MIKSAISAIVFATLALSPVAASAQQTTSTTVRVDDLDLAQAAGIARLRHRVMAAVEMVCTPEEWEDAPILSERKDCRLTATSDADRQIAMILDRTRHLAASATPVETASR